MKYWFAAGAFALSSWAAPAPAEADQDRGANVQELLSALELPVQALALPLLTITARATPPDRVSASRESNTGAACTRFRVNTAAALAGRSETIRPRSRSPLCLMPARAAPKRNPGHCMALVVAESAALGLRNTLPPQAPRKRGEG